MKLLTLTLANIFAASATTKLDSNIRALADEDVKSDVLDPVGPGSDATTAGSAGSTEFATGVLLQ